MVGAFSDLGAYEAGTAGNLATTLAETLPNTGPASGVTPEGDFDGDGASNQDETTAGTILTNPASVFRPVASLDDGDLLIIFPTVNGRTYTLQRSDTLAPASWLPAGLTFTGNGTTTAFRIPVTTPTAASSAWSSASRKDQTDPTAPDRQAQRRNSGYHLPPVTGRDYTP